MLEGPSPPPLSEPGVKNETEELGSSFSLSTNSKTIKPKWLAKITDQKHPLSALMNQMLQESSSHSKRSPSGILLLSLIDRLHIQQRNFLHVISNLSLSFFSSDLKSENLYSLEPDSKEKKEQELIEWLKEKGYSHLAEKLAPQSGYPWDHIKSVHSPLLIEQLVDLYHLSNHKKIESGMREDLMNFAIHLAKMATVSNLKDHDKHSLELIKDAKQVIGQLIYLFNSDPLLAVKIIQDSHNTLAIENLNKAFNTSIQNLCYRLQNHYVAHYETQIQAPDIAVRNMIPVEIAKALLTDTGSINIGIIDILSTIFLSQEEDHLDHEANLSYGLKLLQDSPKFRSEFNKIKAPRSTKMPSNDVIRASLGMESNQPVDAFHTKLAALTALLSHLRQGEEGSCFAASLAIEILSAHLVFCLKDLTELLHESKLSRQVQNVSQDIPFVKRISDENLDKLITIDEKGCILLKNRKGAEIWEAPGLQAACLSVGLTNPQKAIQTILTTKLEKTNKPIELYIKDLIKALCEYAQQQDRLQKPFGDLYAQACFAFSSQTSPPLLKIWENTIASMAEAEEGSMVKTAILVSILNSLQFKLAELHIPPTPLLQRLFLNIRKQLYECIRLQYDPSVRSNGNDNIHSKRGGFVLYCHEKRIDNESLFRTFVQTVLAEIDQLLQAGPLQDSERLELTQSIDTLYSYIDSYDFMTYLLAHYHFSNIAMVSQGAPSYETLPFTPWITQTGNSSKAVLKIYLETDQKLATKRFVPSSPEEALTMIIEMCKQMSPEEKRRFINNPNKRKPFCILGKHRLPFMAGTPSLANAWQNTQQTSDWIREFVIAPGVDIANTPIDRITCKAILKNLKTTVFPRFFSSHEASLYVDLIKQLPKNIAIQSYRESIVSICTKMAAVGPIIDNLAREIDTVIWQSLESNLKKKLENSAIYFADTNWCSGVHDIHFCFAVNPGTGRLELWEAYSNGSHFIALDQNDWLLNQRWEFLHIPEDLIPDDSYD